MEVIVPYADGPIKGKHIRWRTDGLASQLIKHFLPETICVPMNMEEGFTLVEYVLAWVTCDTCECGLLTPVYKCSFDLETNDGAW